jgi:hypothetical protein
MQATHIVITELSDSLPQLASHATYLNSSINLKYFYTSVVPLDKLHCEPVQSDECLCFNTNTFLYNWIETKYGFVKVNCILYFNEKFEETIPFFPNFMGAC